MILREGWSLTIQFNKALPLNVTKQLFAVVRIAT